MQISLFSFSQYIFYPPTPPPPPPPPLFFELPREKVARDEGNYKENWMTNDYDLVFWSNAQDASDLLFAACFVKHIQQGL
jgi:hypothetical protein